MGPFSASDRHDLPGLIDEPVPGFATQRDDIVVGLEYPVGKPVIAHELPYVFDGVQLGRSWWQEHQCDVGWDLEPAGGVPSGPVDDEYSVSAWCHQGRDFIKMPLHGLSVAAGQDKARTDTARGTDGTEDIGRLRALVPERRGSAAASRPAPGELWPTRASSCQSLARISPNPAPRRHRSAPCGVVADILRNPSRPTVVSEMLNIQCARSFRRQRRHRGSPESRSAERALAPVIELGRACLPSRPSGPLAENPVTDHLEPDSTDSLPIANLRISSPH